MAAFKRWLVVKLRAYFRALPHMYIGGKRQWRIPCGMRSSTLVIPRRLFYYGVFACSNAPARRLLPADIQPLFQALSLSRVVKTASRDVHFDVELMFLAFASLDIRRE